MRSRAKIVLVTFGCAGWLVLAACQYGAAVRGERTRSEPVAGAPAVTKTESATASSNATSPTRPPGRSRLSLEDARRLARPEKAAELIEMLKDPAYAEDWGLIAQILPAASPDARSASAIIDYITRKDDWRGLHGGPLNSRMTAKVAAVHALGSIHSPEAVAFLRKVLESAQSARGILRNWLNDKNPPETNVAGPDTILSIFMNQAARGLVIARDPEGIALIRQRNEQFGSYPGAMALNRVIEEKGLDWYKQNLNDAARSLERKYWLESYGESRQKWGMPLPPLPSRPSDRTSEPATRPEAAPREIERPSSATHPATQPADDTPSDDRLGDVRYLAREVAGSPLTLGLARRRVKAEMIPQLLDMLKDPAYAQDWIGIAELLAVGPPDPRSLPAIIDYLTRKDDWRGLSANDLRLRVAAKIGAPALIGWIEGPKSIAFLRKIVDSKQGAQDVLHLWIDERSSEINGGSKETTRILLQNSAAEGLVYARDPQGIALVLDRFQRFGAFRGAVVDKRIIDERGIDWFVENRNNSTFMRLAFEYTRQTFREKPLPNGGPPVRPWPGRLPPSPPASAPTRDG